MTFYRFDNEYDTQGKKYCLNEKIKKNLFLKVFYLFKRIIFIRKITSKFRPNIVISFGPYSNLLVSISSLKRDYKVVLSVRSNINIRHRNIRHLSRFLYNKMDAIHVITKKMANDLKSLGFKNIVHIYNGHNLKLYRRMSEEEMPIHISDEKFLYLNIGRLNYAKGQWHLLKAFSVCAKKDDNLMLIIIGEGRLKKSLRSLIKSLNIEDKVLILNNTLNIFPYIRRANCFCSTSLYEGLPNTMIEALAIDTPIISTDCISGPREVLFPELDVEKKINYPFKSERAMLTEPFGLSDIDISTNICPLEKDYADAMEYFKTTKNNNDKQNDRARIFSEDLIIDKWDKLIYKINKL